jgi:hypothetical protein
MSPFFMNWYPRLNFSIWSDSVPRFPIVTILTTFRMQYSQSSKNRTEYPDPSLRIRHCGKFSVISFTRFRSLAILGVVFHKRQSYSFYQHSDLSIKTRLNSTDFLWPIGWIPFISNVTMSCRVQYCLSITMYSSRFIISSSLL